MHVGEERPERSLVTSWPGAILAATSSRCEVVCWYVSISDWSRYTSCVLNYAGILIEVNATTDSRWGSAFLYRKKEVICWCLCVGPGEIWTLSKLSVSPDGRCQNAVGIIIQMLTSAGNFCGPKRLVRVVVNSRSRSNRDARKSPTTLQVVHLLLVLENASLFRFV